MGKTLWLNYNYRNNYRKCYVLSFLAVVTAESAAGGNLFTSGRKFWGQNAFDVDGGLAFLAPDSHGKRVE